MQHDTFVFTIVTPTNETPLLDTTFTASHSTPIADEFLQKKILQR